MNTGNWVFKEAAYDLKKHFPPPQMFSLKKVKAVFRCSDEYAQGVLDRGVELGVLGQMDHLYCVKRQTAPAQGKGENENPSD